MTDDANPKDALGDKKVNLALVAPASIIHEAMAMENGAKKYGPYNWRTKKVRTMVYVAAGLRHLLEYLDGADYSTDTDPPVHHLGHAKACLGIVLDAMETGNLIDDRPKQSQAATRLVSRSTSPTGRQSVCIQPGCGWVGPWGTFDLHYLQVHVKGLR